MAFIIEIYVVYIKILHKPDTERGTGGTLFRVMGLVCPPRGLHPSHVSPDVGEGWNSAFLNPSQK